MLTPLLFALPWIVLPLVGFWRLSRSTHLNDESDEPPDDAPLVSVICPARDEARHIEDFVRAALASTYPRFELIVVDDHSTDGTGALARATGAGDPRLKVIDPPALPEGWFGKQWACHNGAQQARGSALLFTDADTRHAPDLITRSLNAMRSRHSDLISVADAHRVFAVTHQRVADDAQQMVARVGIAAVIIVNFLGGGVVEQRVGSEIAARRILFLIAEFIVAQQAPVLIGLRILGFDHTAESRHLHHLLAEHHMHQLKAPTDDTRAAKQAAHFFRCGIGRNIEIFGDTLQQQIAHRTAHHIGLIACGLQTVGDFQRAVADLLARHTMQSERNHLGISHHFGLGRLAKYTIEEFFDHAIFKKGASRNGTRQSRVRSADYTPQGFCGFNEKRALRRVPGAANDA